MNLYRYLPQARHKPTHIAEHLALDFKSCQAENNVILGHGIVTFREVGEMQFLEDRKKAMLENKVLYSSDLANCNDACPHFHTQNPENGRSYPQENLR